MNINSWVAWIAGGFTLILLSALAILLVINADQRAELASDHATRLLLLSQNKEWAQKTAVSNAALAKIKAADAANAKAIAKAEMVAAASAKKLKDEADVIAGLKFTGSDCEQVTRLTKTYLDRRP